MYLEFYAGGNVVLVNKEGTIVAVLRIVKGGEGGTGECKVGVEYELSDRTTGGDLRKRIVEALEASLNDDKDPVEGAGAQGTGKRFKKKKKKGEDGVKKVLSAKMSEFSPTLIEHCFLTTGVDLDIKTEEALADDEKLSHIIKAFEEAERMIKEIMNDAHSTGITGYIIAKAPRQHTDSTPSKPKGVSFGTEPTPFGNPEAIESNPEEKIQQSGEAAGMVYDDFFPFLPSQYLSSPSVKAIPFTGYNHTVDTFFSSIESQKLTSRIAEREAAATKRLESARTDHARRVEGLRSAQELNVAKAQAIEANLDRVEEVIAAVNGLVAQGMDWAAMGQLIEQEQKRGNAVAELIKLPLKLFENTVTIILNEEEDFSDDESADESDDEETKDKHPAKTLEIDIDLSLTAYASASSYFAQKKALLVKESKTLQSSSKALKSTERKVASDLKKGLKQEKEVLRPLRQPVWFEKFLFFISSDGYLVLAGRDLQQNEILYKRYFKRGDVYVSADIEGAAMCIIKNNVPGAPVPPSTLSQAGTLSVATSKAWESKSVMSAWWVGYEQVGKTAAGEYLAPGVFEVTGRKNYLPPAQLVLGYGVLWCVDEEGRQRHGRFRVEEKEKREETKGGGAEREEEGEEKEETEEVQEEEEQRKEDEEEEEDSDEEFPDAQIESGGEGPENEAEESEDEEFPDASVQEKDSEPEDPAPNPGASDEDCEKDTASPAPSTRTSTPTGSKHISAKTRRELRKARATGVSTPTPTPTPNPPPSKSKPPTPKPDPTPVRGKKRKQKKLATKYAHQDDEDRALALQLLGSSSTRQKTEDAATTKASKDAEAAAQKQRRREQHAYAAREGLKAEEARRRGNPDEDEEDEDPSTKVPLDCFVGMPMPGDNLLEAIPVCGPWGAMGRYKYKAKMQPGNVKKGRAVKDVVGRWLAEGEKKIDLKSMDSEKMWPREKELIKGWKDTEIVSIYSDRFGEVADVGRLIV